MVSDVDLAEFELDSTEELSENITLDKNQKATYQQVVSETLRQKLQEFLHTQIIKRLNKDNSVANEIQQTLQQELPPGILANYQTLSQNPKNTQLDYEQTVALFNAIQETVAKHKDDKTHGKHYKSLSRAISQVTVATNKDIPKYIENTNTILGMRERKHYKKLKKKSWFRRAIETVLPFLKKDDYERVNTEAVALGSIQKAATKYVTEEVMGSLSKSAQIHLETFDAGVKARESEEKGKRFNIDQQSHPQTSERLEKIQEKLQQKTASSSMTIVGSVAKAFAVGVGQSLAAKTGTYLEGKLKADSDITNKSLVEHIENEFTLVSHRQVFDGMMKYLNDTYSLYVSTERAKENHPHLNLSAAEFGFKRFDNPKFNDFIVDMAKAIGFPAEDISSIEKLYYANEAEKEAAFEKFLNSQRGDPNMGIAAVNGLLSKEHAAVGKDIKKSDNYMLILDHYKEMAEQLTSKDRMKSTVTLLLRENNIEENIYNPNAQSASSHISSHLKTALVQGLNSKMEDFLKGSKESVLLADYKFTIMQENWSRIVSERLNQVDRDNTNSRKSSVSMKGKSPAELTQLWQKSGTVNDQVYDSGEVQTMVGKITTKALSQWQKTAVSVIKNSVKLGGEDLMNAIFEDLQKQHAKLVKSQAHPDIIKDLEERAFVLSAAFKDEENNFHMPDFSEATPKEIAGLLQSMQEGITSVSQKSDQLSLGEREDLFMIGSAIGQMRSAYNITDLSKKAYDQVYMTSLDQIEQQNPGKVASFIANKLGAYFDSTIMSMLEGPVIQLQQYTKQRDSYQLGTDKTTGPRFETKNIEQGWGEWASEKLSTAAGYGQATLGVTMIPLEAIGKTVFEKLTGRDLAGDPESINDAVVKQCQKHIREKSFDAIMNIVSSMELLHTTNNRFQSNYPDLADPFKSMSFGSPDRSAALMAGLAEGLGFQSTEYLFELNNRIVLTDNSISKLESEIKQNKGYIYSNDTTALERRLGEAKEQQEILSKQLKSLRDEFSSPPVNEQSALNDRFVSVKLAIQEEYTRLTNEAKKGELKDSNQYMVLVSSLNNIISQVELVQKETLAIELLAPDIDQKMGYSPNAKGIVSNLTAAARGMGKEYAISGAKSGIMSQLQQHIELANNFAVDMLSASRENMNKELDSAFSEYSSSGSENRASGSENRASGSENRASGSENRASGSENRASGSESRASESERGLSRNNVLLPGFRVAQEQRIAQERRAATNSPQEEVSPAASQIRGRKNK
tara:strand:+ start:217 stop:3963 length:3747 start_codon:yes stop_codon:yes gene_type:complete